MSLLVPVNELIYSVFILFFVFEHLLEIVWIYNTWRSGFISHMHCSAY